MKISTAVADVMQSFINFDVVKQPDTPKVEFRPRESCIVQFMNPRLFGREFLTLEKDVVRTITYMEEGESMMMEFMMVKGQPSGPITTP